MIDPCMYIILNKGLGMSTGKAAAQAAHAAVEAYILTPNDSNLKRLWHRGGHYKKIVLEARDANHLRDAERYINDRGFQTVLIIDEGHTEVAPLTPTAVGVEIVDKHHPHAAATFSTFDLYVEADHDHLFGDLEAAKTAIRELLSVAGSYTVWSMRRIQDALKPANGTVVYYAVLDLAASGEIYLGDDMIVYGLMRKGDSK